MIAYDSSSRAQAVNAAGVANPEITFGEPIDDPPPKRRRKAGKADTAGTAANKGALQNSTAEAAATNGAEAELDTPEPAELARSGAGETEAHAAASIPAKRGKFLRYRTFWCYCCHATSFDVSDFT